MEYAKTPAPPRVTKVKTDSDEALIGRYAELMHRMKAEKEPLEPPKLLSRPDVLAKIKELKDSVQRCRQERVESFLNSKNLRHLMQDHLTDLLLRTVRSSKDSERPSFGPISKESPVASASKEEVSASRLTTERKKSIDSEEIEHDKGAEDEVRGVLPEMEQSELEMNLLEKQKLRVERRLRSATIKVVDTFSGYLNVAEPIYSDTTEFVYKKRWIALNSSDVSLYTSSNHEECLLKISLPNLISVIDEVSEPTSLKVTFRDNEGDCGMMLSFYTDQTKTRCVEVLKTLSKSAGFEYVRSGALPSKSEDFELDRRRTKRFSTYRKTIPANPDPTPQPQIQEESSDEAESAQEHNSQHSEDLLYVSDEGEEAVASLGLTPQGTQITREEQRPRSLTDLAEELDDKGLVNLLTKGGVFLKYGRYGGPKLRHVMVTADLKYIEWRPLNKPHYKSRSGLAVNTIKKVVAGRTTKRFKKFPNPSREEDSFSLLCTDRDFDLEVHKPGVGHNQKVWVAAFEKLAQGLLSRSAVERFISRQHKTD